MRPFRQLALVTAVVALGIVPWQLAQGQEPSPSLDLAGETSLEPSPSSNANPSDGEEQSSQGSTPSPDLAAPVQEPGEVFINANAAYEEGDAAQAISLYRKLLDQNLEEGHLLYNLGNAYLRNGELGKAVASFRRSQVLLPRHQDVKANLAFGRRSSRDAIAPPEPSAVQSTLLFWHYGLSRAELGRVALLINILFWGALALRLFRPESEILRWLVISLLLALLTTGASLFVRHFLPNQIAVVVPQEVDAFNGPDPTSAVRFKLHAGTEVRLEDQRPEWLRISLPDGQQGWIQRSWAEIVGL